jgi:uncharacterized protein (TIGR02246 family)
VRSSIRPLFEPSTVLFAMVASTGACTRSPDKPAEIAPTDAAAIHGTIEAYRRAWLAGDAEGVLATFTEDAVLLPHHGDPPITGKAAIRAYWFAPGPPTTITELALTVDRTSGNASLAFVHGYDKVAWTTKINGTDTRFSNAGTYMNVMKKMADGTWRIQAHMWDDPANRREQ